MNQASQQTIAGSFRDYSNLIGLLRQRQTRIVARNLPIKPFAVRTPDGASHLIGSGVPAFIVTVADEAGVAALGSFDELAISEAFMDGHLDIEGEILQSLRYRAMIGDPHPFRYLYATYLEPLLFGQVRSDKKWIKSHYDIDADFFTLWLDKRIRGYSHAFFERDDESLEDGMERKFRYAMKACGIQPGDRVLDIGGGWGSFLEFAGTMGVQVTSLTISAASENFLNEIIQRKKLNCRAIRKHFLEYRSGERYDAIVNFGVTEHLPDYRRTVENYARLLKPGRRVYLDAYSGERHGMPAFITKWIYEGNTSPLCFEDYMKALARTPLELIEVQNDRHNYFLTCKKWAENLEAARDVVVARWGHHLYQRFRLYLWAAANSFDLGTLSAHHMVLQLPASAA